MFDMNDTGCKTCVSSVQCFVTYVYIRGVGGIDGGGVLTFYFSLPSPSTHSSSLLLPFSFLFLASLPFPFYSPVPCPSLPLPFPPLPLEVGSLNQLGVWGSAVSSSSGVRGRAPVEIEFGAL